MKHYRNRIYNPNGHLNSYGSSRQTNGLKRNDRPYGLKAERYPEKLVPVEKEKQDLDLELKIEKIEADVNDFSLEEHDIDINLEKEAEMKQKEFIEEEDLEAGLIA